MNYKILKKDVFEQAQVRSVSDVEFTEEELQNGMKIAVSKADPTLALYLIDVDGKKKFNVVWDDSSEIFNGWLSAWDNFTWCLSVADAENNAQNAQNHE